MQCPLQVPFGCEMICMLCLATESKGGRKLQMYGVNQMCGITIRHVDNWVVCCDGCHQHVKRQNTQVVANNFTNFWSDKAQSRGKGKESLDILILNWK